MLERRRIVELYRTGRSAVLVTLVRAEGSTYRRPGARLLLAADGTYAGTISGGCLESEVTRKALWLTRNGPVVERYSTLFDDTADLPYGLGCGGTVDLLFERTGTPEAEALLLALEASLTGSEADSTTWLPTPTEPLRRTITSASGQLLFSSPIPQDEAARSAEAVYRERLEAPQRLILFGAWDDAQPVSTIAALLGWNVVVADGRAPLARPARFPEAQAVLSLPNPRTAAQSVGVGASDAVVLMTHSYEQDRDCLASILSAPVSPRYLGILGARHRTALLVAEAAALAGQTLASACSNLRAPIGLDLGGDGPEAIALSIVAEVQAAIHGKPAATRRLTPDEVAIQLRQGDAVRYQPAACPAPALLEPEPEPIR